LYRPFRPHSFIPSLLLLSAGAPIAAITSVAIATIAAIGRVNVLVVVLFAGRDCLPELVFRRLNFLLADLQGVGLYFLSQFFSFFEVLLQLVNLFLLIIFPLEHLGYV